MVSAGRFLRGFTLTELAVVMAIVALLLGGLMYTLSAQTEQRNFEETRRRLDLARELLLSYAVVNGRLPCPARSANTTSPATQVGDEVVTTATGCIADGLTDYYGGSSGGVTLGLLPAKAIGFNPTDSSGFAVDAWNNRIRYAVSGAAPATCTSPTSPHFVNSTNLKANGITCVPNDLIICKAFSAAADCGSTSNQVVAANLVAAIIFSTGKNGSTGGTGVDEASNLDGGGNTNSIFVYHAPTSSDATNGEFDDQFTWITVGELYGKLIAAGVLP